METQDYSLSELVNSMDIGFGELLTKSLEGDSSDNDQLWSLLCERIENDDLNMKSVNYVLFII